MTVPMDAVDQELAVRLRARGVTIGYGRKPVIENLDLEIERGSFTMIIGPNGCGKSTLLRALARTLPVTAGEILLDGRELSTLGSKQVARTLGLLAQSPIAPDGITVFDLVARGRYPHQRLLRQWSDRDQRAVAEAMAATGVSELAGLAANALSGGQRQRVWLALALAQEAEIMLLDEPTTFLDIAHQIEILDLCAGLHRQGRTIVAVLHDLNHAARYATHLITMREGAIVAQGPPAEIVNEALVREVFGLPCRVIDDPESGTPLVIPRLRRP